VVISPPNWQRSRLLKPKLWQNRCMYNRGHLGDAHFFYIINTGTGIIQST
jgi:hypothetical protein